MKKTSIWIFACMVLFCIASCKQSTAQNALEEEMIKEYAQGQDEVQDEVESKTQAKEVKAAAVKKVKEVKEVKLVPETPEVGGLLAPDFQLQDTYQNEYMLSDYRFKQPVLLFFWTTWCPYCQKELQVLNNTYSSLAADGLIVFAINVGEMPNKVQDYVRPLSLSMKVLMDKDTTVSSSYRVMGVPTYVLIDKQGNIVFQDNYFPQNEYKSVLD